MAPRCRFWTPWRDRKDEKNIGEVRVSDEGQGVYSPGKVLRQCQYMVPTFLAKAAENPKLKVLDVGCGSGAIATELAQLVPEGQVIGIDISGAVLESAKVQAEGQDIANISFVKGDACQLPFDDGAFDVVCTHQAVAHFRDHVKAIREMKRVTKNGGIICMREGDLSTAKFGPGYPLLDECFRVIMEVHKVSGGSTDAGRRLKAWAVKAGIPRGSIEETHSAWTYDTLEGRKEYGSHWPARCTQGVFADMAKGLRVSSERLEQYALAWSRWIQDPNASFTMLHGQVIATV